MRKIPSKSLHHHQKTKFRSYIPKAPNLHLHTQKTRDFERREMIGLTLTGWLGFHLTQEKEGKMRFGRPQGGLRCRPSGPTTGTMPSVRSLSTSGGRASRHSRTRKPGSSHYKVVSPEKCTGSPGSTDTWATVTQLKAINPQLKVLFFASRFDRLLRC